MTIKEEKNAPEHEKPAYEKPEVKTYTEVDILETLGPARTMYGEMQDFF